MAGASASSERDARQQCAPLSSSVHAMHPCRTDPPPRSCGPLSLWNVTSTSLVDRHSGHSASSSATCNRERNAHTRDCSFLLLMSAAGCAPQPHSAHLVDRRRQLQEKGALRARQPPLLHRVCGGERALRSAAVHFKCARVIRTADGRTEDKDGCAGVAFWAGSYGERVNGRVRHLQKSTVTQV